MTRPMSAGLGGKLRGVAAVLLLTGFVPAAQGCRGILCEDVKLVQTRSAAPVQVTALNGGAVATVPVLHGQIHPYHLSGGAFDELFAGVERPRAGSRNLVVSFQGITSTDPQRLWLTVSLPRPVDAGQRLTVNGAFAVVHDRTEALAQEWGSRPATPAGTAQVGFSWSRFVSHPANYETTFEATSATGTIDVVRRTEDGFDLAFDVNVADAAGVRHRLVGNAGVRAINEGESCFSPS